MQLVRHWGLPPHLKNVHLGPVPGGTFWALAGAHDLPPGPVSYADLPHLLHWGRVWMQNAQRPGSWVEIRSVADVPTFRVEFQDDYDAVMTYIVVRPFMPEFYFVPTTAKGHLFLRRAQARAWRMYRERIWRKGV